MKNFETNSTEHYAQHGEDLTIAALLQAWTSDKKGRISDLTYLEIGANHPVVLSSTFLLYHRYEMRGVLVEANPELIEALKKARPDDTIVNVAVTNEARDEVTLIVPNYDALATLVPEHLEAFQSEEVILSMLHRLTCPLILRVLTWKCYRIWILKDFDLSSFRSRLQTISFLIMTSKSSLFYSRRIIALSPR